MQCKNLNVRELCNQFIPFSVFFGWSWDATNTAFMSSQQYDLVPVTQSLPNSLAETAPGLVLPDECGYG